MIDVRPWIRPSSLPGDEICPGRPTMQARAVQICPDIAYITHHQAEQGTLGHAVVAQTLSLMYHGPDGSMDQATALGKMRFALDGLEEWTADATRRCVAYAVALVDREVSAGYRVQINVEMHLAGKGIDIARGGTADVLIVSCDNNGVIRRVVIQDHKLGWLDQGHASEHLQLAAYAVMAFDKYLPSDDIEIHLAQGRRRDFTAATFDHQAIEATRQRVKNVVAAASNNDSVIVPSIESCRYCKALCLCRAAREHIMQASEEMALFGVGPEDRVKLSEAASMARRFAEEAGLLAKEWVRGVHADQACKRFEEEGK